MAETLLPYDAEIRECQDISLRILEEVESIREDIALDGEGTVDLHPYAPFVIGGKVNALLSEGIVPVVNDEENAFGKPYVGHDEVAMETAALRRKLGFEVKEAEVEIPQRSIQLIGTPFKFGPFIPPTPVEEIQDLWEENELGFQIQERQASHMSLAQCVTSEDGEPEWSSAFTLPATEIAASPNQQALHYGCSLYEGMSVEQGKDGKINIFRLEDHCERLNRGAKALGMPEVPLDVFKEMVTQTIQANKEYIPPNGKGRLYIRPNYYDAGPQLKLNHSGSYNLSVTAIPIGTSEAYFPKTGKPTKFALAINRARAVEHGLGDVKTAGNYAATIGFVDKAHDAGFAGLAFTDPSGEKVRESHVTGILFVKHQADGQHVIVIPSLDGGDILESITVKTIKETAEELGYKVEERDVNWSTVNDFDEVLAVGTAAAVTPIHKLQLVKFDENNELQHYPSGGGSYIDDNETEFNRGEVGQKVFEHLCAIRTGEVENDYLTEVAV